MIRLFNQQFRKDVEALDKIDEICFIENNGVFYINIKNGKCKISATYDSVYECKSDFILIARKYKDALIHLPDFVKHEPRAKYLAKIELFNHIDLKIDGIISNVSLRNDIFVYDDLASITTGISDDKLSIVICGTDKKTQYYYEDRQTQLTDFYKLAVMFHDITKFIPEKIY